MAWRLILPFGSFIRIPGIPVTKFFPRDLYVPELQLHLDHKTPVVSNLSLIRRRLLEPVHRLPVTIDPYTWGHRLAPDFICIEVYSSGVVRFINAK